MRMFNYSVERWMQQKGYTQSAEFIRLIRNWHDACNRRGLSADTHVKYLTDTYSFLVKGINFNSVPFQFADRYIRGMTWQMFRGFITKHFNMRSTVLLVTKLNIQCMCSINFVQ